MIWLAMAALRARSVLSGALAWFGRNPAMGALCGAVLALLLAWHMISVDRATIARLTADKAHMMAAQVEAGRMAAEALRHEEAVYRQNAITGDQNHDAKFAAVQSVVDDMRDRNRMLRAAVARDAGTTIASAQGGSSPVPAGLPTDTSLSISEADVRACAADAVYAVSAHDWAATLNSDDAPGGPVALPPKLQR